MANPISGFNSLFLFGKEVTWGTPVTRTHALAITRHNVEPDLDVRDIPYLGVANNQVFHNASQSVLLAHDVGGDIEGCVSYDSLAFLLLLEHAMGAVDTTGPATTQYTHTFSLATDGPVGLTGEANDGSGGFDETAEVFAGLLVNQMEISSNARDVMSYRASVIGKASGGMDTISDDFVADLGEEVLGNHAGTVGFNGHGPNLRSWKLTINRNLIRRPYLGSLYTDRPSPGGFASVMVDLSLAWEDNDLYADWLAQVQDDLTLNFTGSGDNRFNFTGQNMKILKVSKPVDRAGELTLNIRAKCYAGAGAQGARIIVKNSNITAN